MIRFRQFRWPGSMIGLAVVLVVLQSCGSNNNSTGSQSGRGSVLLVMHDNPVDSLREVWLTVDSVQFIGGSSATSEAVLSAPVRMNFMALDSLSRIVAMADVNSGAYSKIRLHVTNPEFVQSNSSVIDSSQIKLVANGHVDLNPQGQLLVVKDSTTVVSLDLDLRNSIQVNSTGNDRYILNPQIKVDAGGGSAVRVTATATVLSVNSSTGQLQVQEAGSPRSIVVLTTAQTQIRAVGGLAISLSAVTPGSQIELRGTLNQETGVVTASSIQISM